MSSGQSTQQELPVPEHAHRLTQGRLLILSCSNRKTPAAQPVPAIERYDGPAFRVLRRFLKHADLRGEVPPSLLVISAKHGLIDGQELITNYDEQLALEAVERVRARVLEQVVRQRFCYEDVLISTSRAYEPLLAGIEQHFPPDTRVARTRGPRGKQLAQLRNWLAHKPLSIDTPERHFRPRAVAKLHGVERSLSGDHLLHTAKEWLEEARRSGDRTPWRFLDRYVLVDGERVAPKWLVGRLFQVPLTTFETADARRVLEQLSIPVYTLHPGG